MHQKCGLINKNNPCRCDKKTKGFIQAGWVDAQMMRFNTDYLSKIQDIAPQKSLDLSNILDSRYADLFREQPFQEKKHIDNLLSVVLEDEKIRNLFELN